jgi:flagellar protein FlgJ
MKAYGIYYQKLNELTLLEKKDPKKALKKACAEFEALIWHEIFKEFDRAMIKSNFFPETLEKKFYQDFLYQEIARRISGQPGSLGDYLYKNLLKSPYFKSKTKIADK